MYRKVKKLMYGCVSLRDYDVDEALDCNEDLVIEFEGKTMKVPHDEIKERAGKSTKCRSKFPPYKEYSLINFKWKPE